MNEGVSETVIDRIKSDFEENSLPYTIDLINYFTLKHPELKSHIDRAGGLFYQRESNHGSNAL
jgi:hypothetical protein